jgi:predicted DNA-binding transcriptional regulator YafY
MAKRSPTRAAEATRSVTPERARRLYRLLRLLEAGPQARGTLARKLKLDVRGFYRDLELLRDAGITVAMRNRRYHLDQDADEAVHLLPMPDPRLSLGEARLIAKGRTSAHRKLRQQLEQVTS